jgi:hypothetical protein
MLLQALNFFEIVFVVLSIDLLHAFRPLLKLRMCVFTITTRHSVVFDLCVPTPWHSSAGFVLALAREHRTQQ